MEISFPRSEKLVFLPMLNPIPAILASKPSTPKQTPVSNPKPIFAFKGPAFAEAEAKLAEAIALAPSSEISAPACA